MLDRSMPHIGVLMTKRDTAAYPRARLPQAFTFVPYQNALRDAWCALHVQIGQFDTQEEAQARFDSEYGVNLDMLARNGFFVLDSAGKLAATASLWEGEHFGTLYKRVHWVAVAPEHQRKGLAKALLTRVLDAYQAQKGDQPFLYLTSQTWSWKALRLYEQFGFTRYMGPKPALWRSADFEADARKAWALIDARAAREAQAAATQAQSTSPL